MNIADLLATIRIDWLERVTVLTAAGRASRDDFDAELERFFDALEHAALSGSPGRLDPVIRSWTGSATQTDLAEGRANAVSVIQKMLTATHEVAYKCLGAESALKVLAATTPLFACALEKAARYEMEQHVHYVTGELEEAQRKLEHLDRTKSNFISVAAHELKTPLTLIEGYTTMLRDLLAADKSATLAPTEQLIHGVDTGIRRLNEIVEDMIDVSLIDNQLLSLNLQPVSFTHLLRLAKNEMGPSIQARSQALEIVPFSAMEEVIFADAERLYQALRNVLNNAIKYTPDGGRITIGGRTLPGFIEITIADTGIGIAPDDQAIIFEKFSQLGKVQLHSSGKVKFKGGGPGLGLPIARGIIEAHGGTLWVESPGCDEQSCPGSTFHLLVPMRGEASDPKLTKLFSGKSNTAAHGKTNPISYHPTA
ncbi:MAG: HAMP domain-containing sensor histidine kinase [Chloroflexota bacterium]